MGVRTGLAGALDKVASDGPAWQEGWDEFFRQIADEDATISEALNAALFVANGSRQLPPAWLRSCRGTYYHWAKQSRQAEEQDGESSPPEG